MKNRYLFLAFCLVVAVAIVLAIDHATEGQTQPMNAVTQQPAKQRFSVHFEPGSSELSEVKTGPVTATALPALVGITGKIAYNESLTSRVSSPVSGRVVKLLVDIGTHVHLNQPLAEIDSPDAAAAASDYVKAAVDAQNKKRLAERAQKLFEEQIASRKDLEAAQSDYAQAEAERQRASQHVNNLHLGTTSGTAYMLRSPISGIVTDRQANPGLEVRPDLAAPLFVVTDPQHPWVLLDLPEKALPSVKKGQSFELETDAWPNERFGGRIAAIGMALDPVTRRVAVRGVVDNPNQRLLPEMYARVNLLSDGGTAIRVPNSALVTVGLQTFVIVESGPGTFVRAPVVVGATGPDSSYIVSGLRAGQTIVTEGALLLNAEFDSRA